MEKARPSWACTLAVQLSLCAALYIALSLGHSSRPSVYQNRDEPSDVYFISVRGGHRPLQRQTHLLKLIEKVAKKYKARFVVNVGELGEDDPLTGSASWLFPTPNIPWYTTRASKGSKAGCFLEQVNISHGKTLNVVGMDTGPLQDAPHMESRNGPRSDLLNWLIQTLEATPSDWLIVVGYHPVVVCEVNTEQMEIKQVYEPLHHVFMKYGVSAYLSRQGCTTNTTEGGVEYIGIPGSIQSEPHLAFSDGSSLGEMTDGFLLHRVGSLEITSYFVTAAGVVVNKTIIRQRGKEVM